MIHVSHLTKRFGPRTAVDDLTFEVNRGEVLGFLGPNGAGKSTTMKILTGFMPATEGEVTVAGFNVFESPLEVKRNVGYLPENPPVYLDMDVASYLDFCARIHDVPKTQVKTAVDLALAKTGLGEVRGRIIGNLSKGFRQRVGLAQALIHNPAVLILDEPTVGLDPKQIIEIRQLIKGLAGDHTVILSSHILPEVTATCQRVVVINKGKIVAKDTIESLTQRASGGQVYFLQVRNAAADGLAAIGRIAGVRSAKSADGRIRIELDAKSGEARDQIVETAVQNKMGVLEFSPERLSLEEVFVQLTTTEGEVR